jgi:hypothetical protein
MVGLTLWKWVPLKVVGHTLILSNKRMSVEESVEKIVSLAFLFE